MSTEATPLTRYLARAGSRYTTSDAARIGPILQTLAGKSHPEILAYCTPEDSPLHNDLEWNNEICGNRYRLAQVRSWTQNIIIQIVTTKGEVLEVPAVQKIPVNVINPSDPRKDGNGHALNVIQPFEAVRASPEMSAFVIARDRAEVAALWRKLKRDQASLTSAPWQTLFAAMEAVVQESEPEDELTEVQQQLADAA